MRTYYTFTVSFILLFALTVLPARAAVDTTYVGFVDSSLWFDREPFFSGQEVRVYTTLANSSPADFTGTIEFYDGEAVIGTTRVTLERNGGYQVVWTDWVPDEGNHSVRVRITEATLTPAGGEPEAVEYNKEPAVLDRFIDTDTDGDGIGNKEDVDDDNDGIPDSEDDEPLVKAPETSNSHTDSSVKGGLEDKTTEVVLKIGEVASSTTPKIIAGVKDAIDAIEEFRVKQSENINTKITHVKQRIVEDQVGFEDAPSDTSKAQKRNDPFNQLSLLALTTAGYTLSHKIAFYITGAFIMYFLLRKVVPFLYTIVRRGDDY